MSLPFFFSSRLLPFRQKKGKQGSRRVRPQARSHPERSPVPVNELLTDSSSDAHAFVGFCLRNASKIREAVSAEIREAVSTRRLHL